MKHEIKSAMLFRSKCHVSLIAAFHESVYLYGFIGMCATCATYLVKLFNKYITVPVGHGVMKVSSPNSMTKLRNLVAQVALSAPRF